MRYEYAVCGVDFRAKGLWIASYLYGRASDARSSLSLGDVHAKVWVRSSLHSEYVAATVVSDTVRYYYTSYDTAPTWIQLKCMIFDSEEATYESQVCDLTDSFESLDFGFTHESSGLCFAPEEENPVYLNIGVRSFTTDGYQKVIPKEIVCEVDGTTYPLDPTNPRLDVRQFGYGNFHATVKIWRTSNMYCEGRVTLYLVPAPVQSDILYADISSRSTTSGTTYHGVNIIFRNVYRRDRQFTDYPKVIPGVPKNLEHTADYQGSSILVTAIDTFGTGWASSASDYVRGTSCYYVHQFFNMRTYSGTLTHGFRITKEHYCYLDSWQILDASTDYKRFFPISYELSKGQLHRGLINFTWDTSEEGVTHADTFAIAYNGGEFSKEYPLSKSGDVLRATYQIPPGTYDEICIRIFNKECGLSQTFGILDFEVK